MRRIGITSEKGGVGKSTLAFGLAGALSESGERVVLVDEDVRVASCLGWASLGPVAFDVVGPDGAEAALQTPADFLVVDSEGRPGLNDLREMATAFDVLLIPTGTSRLEVASTLRLWEQLREAGSVESVRVVVTRAAPVGRVGQDARDALREAGVTMCETVIRRLTAHERAAEAGGLVRDVRDPRAGEAWAEITQLAQEVQG